jgi:hypothetical protein
MKLQEQGFIFINDIIKQKTYNESNYFSSPDDYSKISLDFNINENFIDSSFNEEINNNNLITESKTTSYINKDNPYQEKLFEQEVCERCISLEKELIGKNNKIEKLTELYNQLMDDYNKLNSKYKELIKKENNDLGSEIQEKNTKTIENSNIKENNEFQNDHINTIQNIESINGNDKNIQQKKRKMKNNKKENKLGRKTKRESKVEDKYKKENTHDRFSDDNMRKKCKNIIIKHLKQFINDQIKEYYKDNIGNGPNKKELKILGQGERAKSTVELDKVFLEKKLIDIFSQNISSRCCNFDQNHNKGIIEELINDKDEKKKKYFENLFNIKFSDFFKYLKGDIDLKELNGFKFLSLIKEELKINYDEEYINYFIDYLKNFEEKILNKPKNKKSKDTWNN